MFCAPLAGQDADMQHLEEKADAGVQHLEEKEDADMHRLENKQDAACSIWETGRTHLVHQLRCGGDGKQWALQSHLSQHASQGPHIYPCPTGTASQCLYGSHGKMSTACL